MHLPLHTNTTGNTLPITYLIFLWQQASLSIDQSVHICAQVGFDCGSARAATRSRAVLSAAMELFLRRPSHLSWAACHPPPRVTSLQLAAWTRSQSLGTKNQKDSRRSTSDDCCPAFQCDGMATPWIDGNDELPHCRTSTHTIGCGSSIPHHLQVQPATPSTNSSHKLIPCPAGTNSLADTRPNS